MGVRQTFGLYSSEFESSGGTSNTEFGLAIAVHAIFWGIFTPIFGRISDRLGGYIVIIPALIFYSIAMMLMGNNYISGMWLQINLGLFCWFRFSWSSWNHPNSNDLKTFSK